MFASRSIVLVLLLCFQGLVEAVPSPAFDLDLPTDSTTGTVQLTWEAPADSPEGLSFQVEHTPPDAEPFLLNTQSDTTTVISGMREGQHQFRVRALSDQTPSSWSAPHLVENTFIARGKVTLLLTLGALVVLATIAAVILGHRKTLIPQAS